jgi:hypothetical protein
LSHEASSIIVQSLSTTHPRGALTLGRWFFVAGVVSFMLGVVIMAVLLSDRPSTIGDAETGADVGTPTTIFDPTIAYAIGGPAPDLVKLNALSSKQAIWRERGYSGDRAVLGVVPGMDVIELRSLSGTYAGFSQGIGNPSGNTVTEYGTRFSKMGSPEASARVQMALGDGRYFMVRRQGQQLWWGVAPANTGDPDRSSRAISADIVIRVSRANLTLVVNGQEMSVPTPNLDARYTVETLLQNDSSRFTRMNVRVPQVRTGLKPPAVQ